MVSRTPIYCELIDNHESIRTKLKNLRIATIDGPLSAGQFQPHSLDQSCIASPAAGYGVATRHNIPTLKNYSIIGRMVWSRNDGLHDDCRIAKLDGCFGFGLFT